MCRVKLCTLCVKMKPFYIPFLFLFCNEVISQITSPHLDERWESFKQKFNKTYVGHHDKLRRIDWENNLKKIEKHNEEASKGLHSYFIKENHLSDLSNQVYLQKMVKLTKNKIKLDPEKVGDFHHGGSHIPQELNWVDKGFHTPPYNQGNCGSCYAFSVAGVIQFQVFKQTGKLLPLSAQQIVDCSTSSGNLGCAGGSLRNALRYLDRAGGLMAFDEYPYVEKQQRCHFSKAKSIVNVTSWAILPARDERALEAAVATIGPIAVSINASPHTFQLYHSGIYDDPFCFSNVVNHAVLIVGYTKDAWILKNWWGSHWGENGYMSLSRHKNRCGVANYAAYALV